MADARRRSMSDKGSAGADRIPSDPADRLGKSIEVYRVSLAGGALVSGVTGAIGLGVVGYALLQRPHPLTTLLAGSTAVLFALWWLVITLLNSGRRLELRKRGVRFVERGRETALLWEEILAVDVDRADNTYLGVGSVHRRGSNATGPSGLTTKTDWDVTIRGAGGQTIRLRPTFFQAVRDPKKLIAHLRLRAGLGGI